MSVDALTCEQILSTALSYYLLKNDSDSVGFYKLLLIQVQNYGTALMYNLGTKEVKTVVFDDVGNATVLFAFVASIVGIRVVVLSGKKDG